MADEEHLNSDEFESALVRLRPQRANLQRDRVMFGAGQAARPPRSWLGTSITAVGWLTAIGFCGLWLQQPDAVVVTEVRYVDRVVEPEAEPDEQPRTALVSDRPDRNSDLPINVRVRRHGDGNDLESMIASNLLRTNAAPVSVDRTSDRQSDVGSIARDPSADSYIELMRQFTESTRSGFVGEHNL